MSKVGAIIIPLVLIVITGAAIYYFVNQPFFNGQAAPSPSTTTLDSDTTSLPSSGDSSRSAELMAGGSSYLHPNGNFSFLYPNDYQIGNEGMFVRIYKNGPSQKGQTEMYDGVLMLFEPINLQGKSLSEWVDQNIEASTMDSMSKVTKVKAATKVKNYSGHTYSLEGLGESNHVVLQKDNNSGTGVHIIYSTYDPTGVGFDAQVESIIKTLEILK